MEGCIQFTPELKWGCVREIVSTYRSGSVGLQEHLRASQHAADFIGCAAEMFKTDTEPDEPSWTRVDYDASELSVDSLCEQIELLVPVAKNYGITWLQVLQIVRLIMELLNR